MSRILPRRKALTAAVVTSFAGLGASLLLWVIDPPAFARAWLATWLFATGLAGGALVNLMIHELTGGGWGFTLRRPLTSALAAWPVLAVLGLPLAGLLPNLYPWARPGDPEGVANGYLAPGFFLSRAALCLVTWIALAAMLRRAWHRGETNAGALPDSRMRARATFGLLVYACTATVASVDWIMSLSAHWVSTTFGLLTIVGQVFGAFAAATYCAALSGDVTRAAGRATPEISGDLGNILLTYSMLWTYLAFMQFLVIWSEDLPHEIGWYVARATPDWKATAVAAVSLQFALPFVAMLFRGVKRAPRRLAFVCMVALCGQALAMLWNVLPSTRAAPWATAGGFIAALAAIGGACAFVILRAWISTPLRLAPTPAPPEVVEHG